MMLNQHCHAYVEDAKTICRNTKGPVAPIFYQGLERSNEVLKWLKNRRFIRVCADGVIRKRFILDFFIHCTCTHAWIYGYGYWDDWCI